MIVESRSRSVEVQAPDWVNGRHGRSLLVRPCWLTPPDLENAGRTRAQRIGSADGGFHPVRFFPTGAEGDGTGGGGGSGGGLSWGPTALRRSC